MSTHPGNPSTVAALQDTLAAEHAAVYVLSVLGAQTSQSSQPDLYQHVTDAFLVHRERRDALIAMIGDLDATPDAAEPAYQVPASLGTADEIRAAALRLERGCAASYAYAVANTTGQHRRWATGALLDSAVRELGFGGTPQTLPGL